MVDISLAPLGRALLALALLVGPAAADPPAALGARRAAEVTFRDWRLACLGGDCAVRSAVRAADGTPVLAVAADAVALRFATALPLFLPDGLVLTLGDEPPRHVAWRTCGPEGCVADAVLDPALLAALRRERSAEATLTLADGLRIRLPTSLLGFSAAWDAREARGPTPPRPPAPAPRPPAPAAAEPAGGASAGAPGPAPAVDPWDVTLEEVAPEDAAPAAEPGPAAGGISRP